MTTRKGQVAAAASLSAAGVVAGVEAAVSLVVGGVLVVAELLDDSVALDEPRLSVL